MSRVPGEVLVREFERCGRDVDATDGEVGNMGREQRIQQQGDAAGAGAEV